MRPQLNGATFGRARNMRRAFEPMDIDLDALSPEQVSFIEREHDAVQLVARVVELSSELREHVVAKWSTEEPGRYQLEVRDSTGAAIFGHGADRIEAALSAFQTCWREIRYLPRLPPANPYETELLQTGRTMDALKGYMRRNGVGLRDAREKLRV